MKFPTKELAILGDELSDLASSKKFYAQDLVSIHNVLFGCYGKGGVGSSVAVVADRVVDQLDQLKHLAEVVSTASSIYLETEAKSEQIVDKPFLCRAYTLDLRTTGPDSHAPGLVDYLPAAAAWAATWKKYPTVPASVLDMYSSADGQSIQYWHSKTEYASQKGDADCKTTVTIGKASGIFSGEGSLVSTEDKYKTYWDEEKKEISSKKTSEEKYPSGSIKIGGSASVFERKDELKTGDDDWGGKVENTLSIGNADVSIKGEAGLTEDGNVDINIGGKAIVSAVKEKAEGTLSVLGIDISVELDGYVAGIGAEAKAGFEDGTWQTKVGAVIGVGGSVGLKVGLNESGRDSIVSIADDVTSFVDAIIH